MGWFGPDEKEESGYSEEKTDIWGNTYIQRYDNDGKEVGYSKTETGFFGDKYTQDYTQDGQKAGYTTEETGFFGDKYQQHHSEDAKKTGYTTREEGLLGDAYQDHHEQDGDSVGYSQRKTGLFGNRYVQHHGTVPFRQPDAAKESQAESAAAHQSDYTDSDYKPAASAQEPSAMRNLICRWLITPGCVIGAYAGWWLFTRWLSRSFQLAVVSGPSFYNSKALGFCVLTLVFGFLGLFCPFLIGIYIGETARTKKL